jgi:NADH-quinone oxidoreductase subunit H
MLEDALPAAFQLLVFPGLLAAIGIGFLYEGLTRKLAARMQSRVGPPVWQPALDWVKLMFRESVVPRNAFSLLFTALPVLAFAATLTATSLLPVAGLPLIGFPGDMLILIYLLLMGSLAVALAGWASGNPMGFQGSVREVTLLFSYELPFVLSLLTVGMATGFSVLPFVAWQFPFAFAGFLAACLGKLSLPPFHIPDAEQELVAGPLVEYSGSRLGMFHLARAAGFWVMASLGAVLFLGGTETLTLFGPGDVASFLLKSLAVVVVLSVMKAGFSRLRTEQALRLCWLFLSPLVLVDFVRALTGLLVL